MANQSSPVFIQEIIHCYGNELHSKTVSKRVCELVDQGYRVKIIEHEPITQHNVGTAFLTTILATLSDKVEFG